MSKTEFIIRLNELVLTAVFLSLTGSVAGMNIAFFVTFGNGLSLVVAIVSAAIGVALGFLLLRQQRFLIDSYSQTYFGDQKR